MDVYLAIGVSIFDHIYKKREINSWIVQWRDSMCLEKVAWESPRGVGDVQNCNISACLSQSSRYFKSDSPGAACDERGLAGEGELGEDGGLGVGVCGEGGSCHFCCLLSLRFCWKPIAMATFSAVRGLRC